MRRFVPPEAKQIPKQAKKVFQGVIFSVWQWEQELYDGTKKTFEMIGRPDTTVAIAVKGENIVLIKEEQPLLGEYMGLPGGRADRPEEDELQAIQREVREETGMEFATWKLLFAKQGTAKVDHLYYMFLASDFVSQGERELDAGEKMDTVEVSFDEFKKLANSDELRDKIPRDVLDSKSIKDLLELNDLYDTQSIG